MNHVNKPENSPESTRSGTPETVGKRDPVITDRGNWKKQQ